ncbi:MAG: hypothetical protein BWY46_01921 [Firmicutes bacterium ADurb.Bin300]|nr:DUF5343 domain-containing protein [Eubacteriales bacterium]OQA47164.1 MAG: hypothetical protein BWY46_01921 [Firmicutes bacterium ADurb.Bin300]
MADYPYLASNKNVLAVFEKIRTAGKPPKFTNEFIRQMGFTSTNDRAYSPLLKKLGFITDDGTPTQYYDQLRDESTAKKVLADRLKVLYSELFNINTAMQDAPDSEVKGAISRVTGKDEDNVSRIFLTFKALCGIADFKENSHSKAARPQHTIDAEPVIELPKENGNGNVNGSISDVPSFHYNIQIHLPATTDVSVYNAIFKSIRENFK